jgi:hypothetical protein
MVKHRKSNRHKQQQCTKQKPPANKLYDTAMPFSFTGSYQALEQSLETFVQIDGGFLLRELDGGFTVVFRDGHRVTVYHPDHRPAKLPVKGEKPCRYA